MPLDPEQRANAPDRRRKARGGRRSVDIGIRNPDACPDHGTGHSVVVDVVPQGGFIYRRHRCLMPHCEARWDSWQSIIDVTRIRIRALTPPASS